MAKTYMKIDTWWAHGLWDLLVAAKQSLSLSYQPIAFTDSIDYRTTGFSHYRPNPSA